MKTPMKYAAYTTTLCCLALVVFALYFVLATVFADLVTLGGLVIDPWASFDPTGEGFDPALTTQAHLETVLFVLALIAQGLLGVAGVITVLVMLGIAGLCLTGAAGEQAPPMPEPGAEEDVNEWKTFHNLSTSPQHLTDPRPILYQQVT